MGLFDIFKRNTEQNQDRLAQGLEKTKTGILGRLARTVAGKSTIDDDVLDELESILLQSDVGVDTTVKIIRRIRERVAKDKYLNAAELDHLLQDEIARVITEGHGQRALTTASIEAPTSGGKKVPYVIMVVGVNGVGKTTTIGKLSHQFHQAGYKVLLGAADTFRAAAVDQLRIWSQRTNAAFADKGMGADPASVAFEAVRQGLEQNVDVVIVDTAGRLHNKSHLMDELSKIRRTMTKLIPEAPHEVLLVLDASTGQNAYQQATEFTRATQVTALALTKLDGTAKGGVVIGICDKFQIPVKYIGVGEAMTDLQLFNADTFVKGLFKK
jgi:fused signal recognition particle receptor